MTGGLNEGSHELADYLGVPPGLLERLRLEGCLLCRGPARILGVFVPDDPAAYNLGRPPAGKRRVVCYVLCADCGRDPDTRRIEEAIRWRAAIQAN